jgi:hypothetical protein
LWTVPVPVTVKFDLLVADPLGVVTEILPDVAPVGTVAVIIVEEFTTNDASVSLNRTAVAPMSDVPERVIEAPTGPSDGLNDVIAGGDATVNCPGLTPSPLRFVTMMGPVEAPLGTVVVNCLLELIVKPAGVPLNVTPIVSANFRPLIVTDVPTDPDVGLNEVTDGASGDEGLGVGDPSPRLQLSPVLMQSSTICSSVDWFHVFQKSEWRLLPFEVPKFASEERR